MIRAKSTYLALIAVLLSPMTANAMPIVYDITLTGFGDSAGITGTGTATFAETAFDADGVFALSGNFLDFSLTIEGGVIGLADVFLGTQAEYEVSLGELIGFDWFTQGDPSINFFDARIGFAAPISFEVNYEYSLSPQCGLFFGCQLEQEWTRQSVSVPEPSTLALLGIGLFGMGLARRRRKV